MSTIGFHEAGLRRKCIDGTVYRRDDKLATWLAVSAGEIPGIIESLVREGVLRFDGISSKGTERYKLGPRCICFGSSRNTACVVHASDPFNT